MSITEEMELGIPNKISKNPKNVAITPEFLGALGECCYKQYSNLKGWAWTSTEKIYRTPMHNDRIEFVYGFNRILVDIPLDIQKEIYNITRPSNRDEASPSFVYDFLACKAFESDDPRRLDGLNPNNFRWVEVKTGNSVLSNNQIRTLHKISLPLAIFRIPNILDPPQDWKVMWEEGYGGYWLNQYKQNSD